MLYLGGLTAHSHLLIPRHYMDSRTSFFVRCSTLTLSDFTSNFSSLYTSRLLFSSRLGTWSEGAWPSLILIKPLGQGVQHLWVSNVHTQVQYPLKSTPECMFCNSTSNVHFHLSSSEWAESTDYTQDWMVSSASVQAALPFLLWSGRTGIFTLSQAPAFYMVLNQCFKCA